MSKAPEDFATKYTKTNWVSRRLLDGFFGAVETLVKGREIGSAIEVGCGEGFSTRRLRAMLPAGASFRASDVEDRLVAAAAKANPDVPVAKESIYQLPHADGAFDLVFCLEVLEHLDDPGRALAQLVRVSRRWLVLSVPREPVWRLMNLARLKYIAGLGNTPGHIQHWSAGAFARFVGQSCNVLAVRTPLPWTILLAEVPSPGGKGV